MEGSNEAIRRDNDESYNGYQHMKGQGLIEEQSSKRYFLLVTLGI
jgi:hypothetical protein